MRTYYIMNDDVVIEEPGVKHSKVYSMLKQLNDELAKKGYVAVHGKILCVLLESKMLWMRSESNVKEILRSQFMRTKHKELSM